MKSNPMLPRHLRKGVLKQPSDLNRLIVYPSPTDYDSHFVPELSFIVNEPV